MVTWHLTAMPGRKLHTKERSETCYGFFLQFHAVPDRAENDSNRGRHRLPDLNLQASQILGALLPHCSDLRCELRARVESVAEGVWNRDCRRCKLMGKAIDYQSLIGPIVDEAIACHLNLKIVDALASTSRLNCFISGIDVNVPQETCLRW